MSDKPSATFTINCAGCYKTITNPYTGAWDFEFRIEQLISKGGWIRRDFGPNARLWFCGPECAHHSFAAVQCKEWWRKHNEAKTISVWKAVVYTVMTIVLTLLAAFGIQHLIGK